MENEETNPPVAEERVPGKWEFVEIMGHQQLAGYVTEVVRFGAPCLQIEVPALDGRPAFVRRFSASALFSETEISEQVALGWLRANRPLPASRELLEAAGEIAPRPALSNIPEGDIVEDHAIDDASREDEDDRQMVEVD